MWTGQTALGQIGQMAASGQMSMAPVGGVVNRAVAGLQSLEENGPGWLYYGINAADRGLGYNGSYFTLGGFVPYAEDDLGGLWSADLRSHLSTYGGFFSNVGLVRKQFMGGTIGGIGIYWDYDADQNQYPTSGQCGTGTFGQFGHVYNQVGVSGEWLTDYGNLRSNGYIPVGTAAYTAGNPGSAFFQNYVMCNYGLDAALAGADLEVGAYVPGLADWAGMVSVGGYTFGQARYNWNAGSKAGQDVVPYFGGVYGRLDLTMMRNWDLSLQANNDSYFDWTGFARITYRMGGSRRRNVPDQMEQPMMRNEHIVRAHQTPEVAYNPTTGTPWRVIHVNNAAAGPGNGSAETPFTTLAGADAAATNPWDVVLVARGNGTATGYNTEFSFNAPNQSLIGIGSAAFLNSACCGPINIGGPSGPLPLLSNPAGTSVFIDGAIAGGARVANLNITGSQVGIAGTGNLTSAIGRPSSVNNVTIAGSGLSDPQTGVYLQDATGSMIFTNTAIANMTNGGFVVDGGDPNVNYQGSITNDTASNGGVVSPLIQITNTTGGTINLAVGAAPNGSTIPNVISDTGGGGIVIADNTGGEINIGNATLTNTVPTAVTVENSLATINMTNATIDKDTIGAAINVDGGAPVFNYQGKITNQQGNMLHVNGTTGGAVTLVSASGSPFVENGDGILVENSAGDVTVLGAKIASQQEGILIRNSSGVNTMNDISITAALNAGVSLQGNTGTDQFNNLSIVTTDATGFLANTANIVNVTGNSSVATTGAPAVSMTNVQQANVNFVSVASTDSTGNGVLLKNTTGDFNATTVNVTNSTGSGFVVRDSTNLNVQVGTATITTAATPGSNGIEVVNSTSPVGGAIGFNTIDVTTSGGTGLLVSKSDLVKVAGGTIDATGGAAIDSTGSNVDITLASMTSTNSSTNGVNLVQTSGTVVSQQTSVATPAGVGINLVDNVPGFIADFGVTTVSNSGGIGVNITNATPPSPDNLTSFDSLNIATTNATGLRAINGGTVNFNSPATVAATGGAALILENTVGTTNSVAGSGWTFASLNSTNSTSNGILLRNLNSDLVVQGTTTIDAAASTSVAILDTQTPAGNYNIRFNTLDITNRQAAGLTVDGIAGQVIIENLIVDNAAAAPGSAVSITNTFAAGGSTYINGGTIADSSGNGIFVQDAILAVQNTKVDTPFSNALFVLSNAGQTSTVSYNGGILTGAGNDGVLLQASGGGTINATILQNSISVILNPVEALVLDAPSQILLNAANNFGTGGGAPTAGNFVLTNSAGGILQISQATLADLSTTNSGVAVTETTAGTVTFDAIVPTPPPPTP
jgi:hypothetical protein